MPDIDSPTAKNVTAIIEASGGHGVAAGGGGGAAVKALSKRPRDEPSPVSGKRGRGENGDLLTVQVPHPSSPSSLSSQKTAKNINSSLPSLPPPPLLESPSKLNRQAAASPCPAEASTASLSSPFGEFSGPVDTTITAKHQWPSPSSTQPADGGNSSRSVSWAHAAQQPKKIIVPPPKARPSLAATDPVFHAALLRVLQRRGGGACSVAQGWRWSGDAPSRFSHWPCALHPELMNLLAYISASEERVVLTGCDVKSQRNGVEDCCSNGDARTLLPPPPPREPSPWRAVSTASTTSPRAHRHRANDSLGSPSSILDASLPVSEAGVTPIAPRARSFLSPAAFTPSSALRRASAPTPESRARSAAKSRGVRFATHDMTVVDTPDPIRGGSEEGMVSALGGLQAILSAAERVRLAAGSLDAEAPSAAGRRGNVGGGVISGRGVSATAKHGGFEGYFDRFASGSTGGCNSNKRGEDGSDSDDDCVDGDAAMAVPAEGAADPAVPARSAERPTENLSVGEKGSDPTPSSRAKDSKNSSGGPLASGNSKVNQVDSRTPAGNNEKREATALCGEGAGDSAVAMEGAARASSSGTEEGEHLAQDLAALVNVLEEMAACDTAPTELELDAGWGPEHSNATAFYARELATLCGMGDTLKGVHGDVTGILGAVRASHLRVRCLDVLSCLIRYNLKVTNGFFSSFSCTVCCPLFDGPTAIISL